MTPFPTPLMRGATAALLLLLTACRADDPLLDAPPKPVPLIRYGVPYTNSRLLAPVRFDTQSTNWVHVGNWTHFDAPAPGLPAGFTMNVPLGTMGCFGPNGVVENRTFPFSQTADHPGLSAVPPDAAVLWPELSTTVDNPFAGGMVTVLVNPDTQTYPHLVRELTAGRRPHRDSVRPEELLNRLSRGDAPVAQADPLGVRLQCAPAPWDRDSLLYRVALQVPPAETPHAPTGLIVVVDHSPSMAGSEGWARTLDPLSRLLARLDADDRVCLLAFSENVRVLHPTARGDATAELVDALATAPGPTHGPGRVHRALDAAYEQACQMEAAGLRPHVVLVTDGHFFNDTGEALLLDRVRTQRQAGYPLSVMACAGRLGPAPFLAELASQGRGRWAGASEADAVEEPARVLAAGIWPVVDDLTVSVCFTGKGRLIGYPRTVGRHGADTCTTGAGTGDRFTLLLEDKPKADLPTRTFAVRVHYRVAGADETTYQAFTAADLDTHEDNPFRLAAAAAGLGALLRGRPLGQWGSYASIRAYLDTVPEDEPTGARQQLAALLDMAEAVHQSP